MCRGSGSSVQSSNGAAGDVAGTPSPPDGILTEVAPGAFFCEAPLRKRAVRDTVIPRKALLVPAALRATMLVLSYGRRCLLNLKLNRESSDFVI